MNISEFLVFIRSEEGGEHAKSFHSQLAKRGLECNYPTYKKIENGQLLPSPSLVSQIAEALPPAWKEELLLAYVRTQLPEYAYLFPGEMNARTPAPKARPAPTPSGSAVRELTKRQISILARSSAHYHLFLMLSLARRPLPRKELEKKFRREFEKIMTDFEDGEFLLPEESGIAMRTTDWKFPNSLEEPSLAKTYKQFDEWDLQFGDQFGFEILLQRMLIRRISPRYLALIQKQLEICLDLVRTSDELDSRYNESLVQVRVQLKSGNVPG